MKRPIDADNHKRAKKTPLRSGTFLRIVRMVLPYRGFLVVGITASVVYALFHSVSILGALPILKVLLEEEGLHGWIDRSGAGMRLGVTLEVRDSTPSLLSGSVDVEGEVPLDREARGGARRQPGGPGDVYVAALVVRGIDRKSGLHRQGLRQGDQILTLNGDSPSPREWLTRVASANRNTRISFTAKRSGGDPGGSIRAPDSLDPGRRSGVAEHTVTLLQPSWLWRTGRLLASLTPRENNAASRLTTLTYVLGVVVLLVIIANLARFVSQYCIGRAVLRAMMDLRRTLYAKVLRLPMSRFTRDTGDIVSRLIQDIQEVQRGVMSLFGKSIREPLKAAFILIFALILDWGITVTMILVAPGALLLFWRVGMSIKKANRKLLRGYGVMIDTISNTLAAIGIVKAYTNENAEQLRLMRIDRRMFRQQLKIVRMQAMLSPALEVLSIVAVSIVTVWLGGRVLSREMDLSKFGTLVLVLAMLFDPLRKMADVYARILRSAAASERLCETLDGKDEAELHVGTVELRPLTSEIEFRNVTFVYPQSQALALDNVNLIVKRGETVALVGANGSGKTTLVNMLTRFYDPQNGAVFFDGVDIRTATLRSLRKRIGLVTQDSVVFPAPLAENIAYGTRDGTREAVIDAAKRAFADEFIRMKPQGYDTVPGSMGKTLSGGEKQRIAIARAIFRDAPILIFDEATSQIDSESEQKIQTALKEFAQNRTTFIIAHRLSTIRFADRIIVMDAGRIVDTGTHEELLERCPLYHGLCETQLLS